MCQSGIRTLGRSIFVTYVSKRKGRSIGVGRRYRTVKCEVGKPHRVKPTCRQMTVPMMSSSAEEIAPPWTWPSLAVFVQRRRRRGANQDVRKAQGPLFFAQLPSSSTRPGPEPRRVRWLTTHDSIDSADFSTKVLLIGTGSVAGRPCPHKNRASCHSSLRLWQRANLHRMPYPT